MTERLIKILVVEDEMIIGAKISMFLSELGYEVCGLFPRAEDALHQVKITTPDIALLDIQLKGSMDGTALGKILYNEYGIPVVFLTANSDEASFQKAKEARPYAFLVKPFKKRDLQRALELTLSLMANQAKQVSAPPSTAADVVETLADRIFVRYKDKMVKIMLEDILYLEADRNYCKIVTTDKEYLLTMPMKSLEDKFPTTLFQRIHRSYIVNIQQVDEIVENQVIVGQKSLPLSKSLREEFLTRIKTV